MNELEILKEQNRILKTALQDQIDYHHFIGNRDCKITTNEALNHLYRGAQIALQRSFNLEQENSTVNEK